MVGAGIIGLTSAFRLAQAGHSVTIFDPTPARGATWAAAGMLAPSAEIAPGEESNYALQKSAVAQWHHVARELSIVTGRQLAIHETGTLIVGWDASDRRLIDQFGEVAKSFGAECGEVTRVSAPELFAVLSPRISSGLLMSGDAWIDPDEAVSILRRALEALNVRTVAEEVLSISSDATGVSVKTNTARELIRLLSLEGEVKQYGPRNDSIWDKTDKFGTCALWEMLTAAPGQVKFSHLRKSIDDAATARGAKKKKKVKAEK